MFEREATLLVKRVRELPNGNILLEKHLFFLSESDIMELRKKTNWVKGSKGLFAGSVSNGAGGYTKMTGKERKHVSREIITWNPGFKDGSSHCWQCDGYFYGFTVVEPGTYIFDLKMEIEGNREKIKEWRKSYDE